MTIGRVEGQAALTDGFASRVTSLVAASTIVLYSFFWWFSLCLLRSLVL